MLENEIILDYILSLPPPCALYEYYSDWFRQCFEAYYDDSIKYEYNKHISDDLLAKYNQSLLKLDQLEAILVCKKLERHNKVYLIGTTIEEVNIKDEVIDQREYKFVYQQIQLICNEYKVYLTDSNPNLITNNTFPEDTFYFGTQVKSSGMNPNSKVYNMFNKRKQDDFNPLNIPMEYQQHEENGIDFDPNGPLNQGGKSNTIALSYDTNNHNFNAYQHSDI